MNALRFVAAPALFVALATVAGCGGSAPPATTPTTPIAVAPPPTVAIVLATPKAVAAPRTTDGPSLGQLDFPVTGSADCQRRFREGMLALHSFLYDQAHEVFAAALTADPRCSMAAWGDAMTYDHPVWHERDVGKGRAALARVTAEDALTAKERAYLGAARALYARDSLKEAHADWLAATAAMHHDYPDDDEVLLQHALALLALYGYDPAHVREQMEAGSIALSVLQRRPEHPGAAHYAIHAFDSREHAILALPAARTYARIAPAAGHAQHMPSHTFTHLGMWREVVPSNERAYAASVAWEKAHGHTPSKYDWHAYSWLVAADLELGQPTRARQLLDDAGAMLVAGKDDTALLRVGYVEMVADYVTQTGRWHEVEALVAPVLAQTVGEGTEGNGPVACAMHAPGAGTEVRPPVALFARMVAHVLRAEAAIRAGDAGTAAKRVGDLKAVRAQTAAWSKMLRPEFGVEWDAIGEALLARAGARAKPSPAQDRKVLDALERLARIESARGSAGPAFEGTALETLGETLLAAGKASDALAKFEADLDARPNRAIALLGAARAAKAAGSVDRARAHYATLADLWRDADADLPALAEVRAGAR